MKAASHPHWLDTLLIGFLLVFINIASLMYIRSQSTGSNENVDDLRTVATKLEAAGVNGEAAEYYERWLERTSAPATARANVGLARARLLESEGRLEEALGQLYLVEILAPASGSAHKAGQRIVAILDRLGLNQAARTALDARTHLSTSPGGHPKEETSDRVVARIEGDPLTLTDFQHFLDSLPAPMRKKDWTREEREQLLTQFVANELMVRRAETRGIEDDPEVRRQLEAFKKQVLVSRLLEEELSSKSPPEESDLRNFYQVHADRFAPADGTPPPFEQVRDEVERLYMLNRLQEASAHILNEAVSARKVELYPEAAGAAPSAKPTTGGG